MRCQSINSPDYRRRALQCFSAAQDIMISGEEREKLLTLHTGLLQLADTQDWLNGIGPDHAHELDNQNSSRHRPSA